MRDQSTPPFLLQQLADAVDTVSTGPFGSLLHKKDYVANAVPVLNPINIGDGIVTTDFSKCVTEEKAQELKAYRLKRGDILVGRRGDIGRCGVVGKEHEGALCGTGCFFVRCGSKVDADFLALQISAPAARERLLHASTGATMANLSNTSLKSLPIWIPPLFEQKRIVAVLDDAFEGLARARAHAEANLQNSMELFDSILKSLFAQAAEAWPTKSLNEIAENLDRRRVPITKRDRVVGEVPYYGASGIVDHVADFIFDEDLLLVSEDGANLLARTYPIAFSISGKSWVNNHAHVLKFDDIDAQEYCRLYLNSISLEPYVSGMAQPKLNQAALNRIQIPFPSPDVRAMTVRKAAELYSSTKELSDLYISDCKDIDELRQSLLQKAFSGELT